MKQYHYDHHSFWIIWLSFLIAISLQILPWPRQFNLFRPSFTNLLLIYWIMELPHLINVGTGFFIGLIIDLFIGSLLGIRALALSILAYLVVLKFQLFHNMNIWLQVMIIILLSLTNQLIIFWVGFLVIHIPFRPEIFLISIIDGMLWPWLFIFMRKICCQFSI